MILLQLSSGQGPEECCLAVALAYKAVQKQCSEQGVVLNAIEIVSANTEGYKSVLVELIGEAAIRIANEWSGSMLWQCQSPYRPKHKRKNWFFSGETFEINKMTFDRTIEYKACRASGAGGQHVNTTDSAIRATHKTTGISVRIESERSQHANKRLAQALIFKKLEEEKQSTLSSQERQRWQQHKQLERGNARHCFSGMQFRRKSGGSSVG